MVPGEDMEAADGLRTRATEPLHRRVVLASVAGSLLFAGVAFMVRHDGYPEHRFIDAPDRQWLIDRASGTLALADPASGRVVVRLDTERPGHDLEIAQGSAAAYLVDHTAGELLTIDEQDVRLTATRSIPELVSAGERWSYDSNDTSIVALPERGSVGVVIPAQGEPRAFELAPSRSAALTASDNGVWQLLDGDRRTEVIQPQGGRLLLGPRSSDSAISALGTDVAVFDRYTGELNWLVASTQVQLSGEIDTEHAALQVASPSGECLWIGAADQLICAGSGGIIERRQITDGVQIQATDQLTVSDRTAVIVSNRGVINRIDLDTGLATRVPFEAVGDVEVSRREHDIWIDDRSSSLALAVRNSAIQQFDKLDLRAPLFAASGVPLDVGGVGDRNATPGSSASGPLPDPTDEASVVAVGPDNDGIAEAPVAADDEAAGRSGRSFGINLLANDFDPDGDPIVIESTSDPAHATIDIITSGMVQFHATAGFVGRDTFTYTIEDSTGRRETGRVTVEILAADGPNRAPVVNPDARQTAVASPVSLDVLANDSDADDDQLTIVALSPIDSQDGTLVIAERDDGRQILKFTPGPAASGRTLSFTYRASDGTQISTPATVTLAVAGKSTVNRPPVAVADAARVRAGRTVSIPILANDFDPDGDSLTLLTPAVPDGRVTIVGDTIELTTSASSRGQVSFEYTVADDDGAEATGTVLVQLVDPATPNIAPITRPDRHTITGPTFQFDPVANDFDPDGDSLTLDGAVSAPPGLIVTPSGNQLTLTPGPDFRSGVVTYQVTDKAGGTTTGSILVIVDRTSSSTRPPPVPPTVPPSNPASPPATTAPRPAPSPPPASSTPPPPTTRPVVPPSTTTPPVTVTPPPPPSTGGNLPPIALADNTSSGGAVVTIDVLSNDRDPEGAQLNARLISPPAATEGRAEPAGTGSFTFVPAAGFIGTATFTYVAVDPAGLTSPATLVTITVTGCVATPPIATSRPNEFTPYLTPLSINVLDESQRSYAVTIGAVTGGTAQRGATAGQVVFSPNVGNNGAGSFEFIVRNPCGEQRTGLVTIDVNHPPALADISRTMSRDSTLTVDVGEQGTDDEAIRFSTASASSGAVTLAADGRGLRFTPPSGYTGQVSIKVVVTDIGGLNASAIITVDVTGPANQAPIAIKDLVDTRPGSQLVVTPLDNDSDPDGPHEDLRIELVDGDVHFDGDNPDIHLSADGRSVVVDISSTAHGRGTFRYRAVDAFGARSDTVKVAIVVNVSPNSFEFSVTLPRGGSTTLRPLRWKVMDNDGDPVEIVSVRGSDPSYAVSLIDPETITLTTSIESPDSGLLTFVVVDAWGARSTSTINVLSTD